jgi:DNA modification methylase
MTLEIATYQHQLDIITGKTTTPVWLPPQDFATKIPQHLLNIEDKNRSNLFNWRGQFSPQLVEYLIDAYCPKNATILDPFVGSGTTLLEAAYRGVPAFGFEINPSAWSFSKLYEFTNLPQNIRENAITELSNAIKAEFPIVLFTSQSLRLEDVEERMIRIGRALSEKAKILNNALIVLLDIYNNSVSNELIHSKLASLAKLLRNLPYSEGTIKADLHDARRMPLKNHSVDFVITSPPYINVFNYHQNYRRSVEMMGWNVLQIARSEIGSNRANRSNRFLTVIQYCLDMAKALEEMSRVLKIGGKAVLVVGYESKVLGTPFYNAEIIRQIACDLGPFEVALQQRRTFKNRFGQLIREDILNLIRHEYSADSEQAKAVGKNAAHKALQSATSEVPRKNHDLLRDALLQVNKIKGTPIFGSVSYSDYQTRDYVTMVKEQKEE